MLVAHGDLFDITRKFRAIHVARTGGFLRTSGVRQTNILEERPGTPGDDISGGQTLRCGLPETIEFEWSLSSFFNTKRCDPKHHNFWGYNRSVSFQFFKNISKDKRFLSYLTREESPLNPSFVTGWLSLVR